MITPRSVRFLHYGFEPGSYAGHDSQPWARIRASEVASERDVAEAELLEPARAAFRAAVAADLSGSQHIVPLSGGLDSRFLLATLVEAGLRDSLLAVTFGVPGTFDFELAPRVARALGVRHEAIDLAMLPLDHAGLAAAVRRAPWTPVHEAFYNHAIPRRYGTEATYWSGFLANSMAGTDLEVPSDTWEIARGEFARLCRVVKSTQLTPPGFRPEDALPDEPPLADSCLTYYEQLFLCLRHPHRNEPALLPSGYDYRTPFRRPEWVEFILRVPRRYRLHQSLYRKLLDHAFPEVFALPTKNTLGLSLEASRWRTQLRRATLKLERIVRQRAPRLIKQVNPKLNYAGFDQALRRPDGLGAVVRAALARLRERGSVDWLDISALEARHRRRAGNHGDALMHLAALELNLAECAASVPPCA